MTKIRTVRTPCRRLEVSHVLAVPPDDAWDLFVDTTQWPVWSPVVTGVESTDRRVRTGTTGRVRAPGVWLPFEITERTDRSWSWEVARLPAARHRVDDLGTERCRLAFELPLHATGTVPICLRALERIEELLET